LVVNVDLAPTIVEATGVDAPDASGKSLLPLLSGDLSRRRSRFLFEHVGCGSTYCGIRSDRWKYVHYCLRSGTQGPDHIDGRRRRDWICAKGGDDTIDVRPGHRFLRRGIRPRPRR
jgi:arylsulfatase A-like enzyme